MRIINKWRRRRQLRTGLRHAASEKFSAGEISPEEYTEVLTATHDKDRMEDLMDQITMNQSALGGPAWDSIVEWLKEHWIDIVKILITLVLMDSPLGEEEEDDYSDDDYGDDYGDDDDDDETYTTPDLENE